MLNVNNVVSGYGNIEVLHGVSINVTEKKIVALIGPNGAGKSTLMKTIFGYLKARQGSIIFDGESLMGLTPEKILRKGIAYIPQGRSVFPDMTVLENLRIGGYILDSSQLKKSISEVISMFPILEKRKKQRAGSLSGGEQRMLELGRCLLLHPEFILMDEPSLGLAPGVVDETYRKIEEINDDMGTTFLIVEQNVRKVLSVADHAYVLVLGRNAFEGSSENLLRNSELRKLYLGD